MQLGNWNWHILKVLIRGGKRFQSPLIVKMADRYEHPSEGSDEENMEVIYRDFTLWAVENECIIYDFNKEQTGRQEMA